MAILNALKWAGVRVRARDAIPFLEFSCRMYKDDEDPGTHDSDFNRMLRYVAKRHFRVHQPKKLCLKDLREHIKAGGAAAVGYYWSEGGHYTLLVGTKGRGFVAANDTRADKRRTMSYKRRITVYNWLRSGRASIWLLDKPTGEQLATRGDNGSHGEERPEKARGRKQRNQAGAPRLPRTCT